MLTNEVALSTSMLLEHTQVLGGNLNKVQLEPAWNTTSKHGLTLSTLGFLHFLLYVTNANPCHALPLKFIWQHLKAELLKGARNLNHAEMRTFQSETELGNFLSQTVMEEKLKIWISIRLNQITEHGFLPHHQIFVSNHWLLLGAEITSIE